MNFWQIELYSNKELKVIPASLSQSKTFIFSSEADIR